MKSLPGSGIVIQNYRTENPHAPFIPHSRRRTAAMRHLRGRLQRRRLPTAGGFVCPCCGSHAWVAETPERPGIADYFDCTEWMAAQDRAVEAATQVRVYISILTGLCENDYPLKRVGAFLVLGMKRCLDAYGAMLWIAGRRRWWSRRAAPRLAAFEGEVDSPYFARKSWPRNRTSYAPQRWPEGRTLLIGVPVKREKRVLGAIEVLQRGGGGPACRERLRPFRQ